MNIALIAHDNKKELMVSFCIAYKGILQKHNLYATDTTGTIVKKNTDLSIFLHSPGILGGLQQIDTRVSCGEIDLVIYFADTMQIEGSDSPGSRQIFFNCDTHNIPFATNIATAEVLVRGLERGDLAWRELLK